MKLLLLSLISVLFVQTLGQFQKFTSQSFKNIFNKKVEELKQQNSNDVEYVAYNFTQKVDHLQFNNNATFQQKYLIRDKFYKKGGPIFFYTGNEGPVEMFYSNTGFLNNVLAEKFGALVVYCEHRYYGDSWPFGDEKESYKKENLIFLSSLQALYDYNLFITHIQQQYGGKDIPIVTFGGSYGGMLASWMRMKFPNIVDGALGASAPIVYFKNRKDLDLNSFYQIATSNYEQDKCSDKIREAFRRLELYEKGASKRVLEMFNSTFKLCKPIKKVSEISDLIFYIEEAYSYMAMTNYPYETSFLKKLPAWPANYSCNALKNVTLDDSDWNLFSAIRESIETFYNFDGKAKCNDIFGGESSSADEDMSGWEIQACGDMVMPMESNGKKDMFPVEQWDSEAYNSKCYQDWALYPNYDWAIDFFGGKTDVEFSGYSNIFLSNGQLDPWAGGGVYYNNKENDFQALLMPLCAHHLDLRDPNPADPQTVIEGRKLEVEAISRWIKQKQDKVLKQQQQQIEQ